ncbi:MAG: DUF4256 domain-containing protein [Sphingobacterium sp.]
MSVTLNSKSLNAEEQQKLINTLHSRFEKNMQRHQELNWDYIIERLLKRPSVLWSLYQMEESLGEPDVVNYDKENDQFIFMDCSIETPKNRRSLCYDLEALESRKAHKPKDSAVEVAASMGIQLLNEQEYYFLQTLGDFDNKTSSWLKTPVEVREKGGAIFGDKRFGRVFTYHNGADSYYGVRGFRGVLKV